MPDKRTHRGANPQDAAIFATAAIDSLRRAVADYSLLLTKSYAEKSSLKLVGDRFSLTARQRIAVMRSVCSDEQLTRRKTKQVAISEIANKQIAIDGYNVLITIESAIAGGVILRGRDCCCRDLASIHGTYRKVAETITALEMIGSFLAQADVSKALWLLDRPVSNSGRLKTLMQKIAGEKSFPWEIELVPNPDETLKKSDFVVATSDSVILDNCHSWINLATEIIEKQLPATRIIDLSDASGN